MYNSRDTMVKSKLRGHDISFINDEFLYLDDMSPTVGNERNCGFCGKKNTREGYDGCLGIVPNIMNACCGHGVEDEAYLQFWDGKRISGKQATNKIFEIQTGKYSVCIKYM